MTDYERPSKVLAINCVIACAFIELGFVTRSHRAVSEAPAMEAGSGEKGRAGAFDTAI
jgi:hypothetical protein